MPRYNDDAGRKYGERYKNTVYTIGALPLGHFPPYTHTHTPTHARIYRK